jgi:hypothetical protein
VDIYSNILTSAVTLETVKYSMQGGQWTLWWITAQTPWGILVLGKCPEEFGPELQYDGTRDTTGEGMLLVSNYGLRELFSL